MDHKYITWSKSDKSYEVRLPRKVAIELGQHRRIGRRKDLNAAIELRDKTFIAYGLDIPNTVATKDYDSVIKETADNGLDVSFNVPVIKTLDELLESAEIDPAHWMVERAYPNAWTSTNKKGDVHQNYQVKATLKRRLTEFDVDYFKSLIEDIPQARPTERVEPLGDHLLEINIPDLHLGKLAWIDEVGENYDLKIARERFLLSINRLVTLSKAYPVEKIIFPIGSDFLHVDTMQNTTTAGTAQDTEGRWAKLYTLGVDLLIEAIDILRHIAPVEAILVTGNHDTTSSYCAAHAVDMYFRQCDDITVDWSPALRKYRKYFGNAIGLAHGHGVKQNEWYEVMASECEFWGECRFRELHLGHKHHQNVDERKGLTIRHLGSLSGTDSWHNEHGYIQTRKSAAAFVYTRDHGICAELTCNM